MKIYISDHDVPHAVPEDGSESDIDGFTRFVKLDDARAALVEITDVVAQRNKRIAELEAELADLVHPFDLAAYREKNLHK